VGGLNAGGRGYYALDVTDPANPKGLWEFCVDLANPSLCAISDPDLGYSFGRAVIAKRPGDGKWVVIVTSGYNNVLSGDGNGYLYVLDAATGAVLSKAGTTIAGAPVGTSATPSGFARIAGFALNFAVNNTVTVVYGGDLLGNVWRFDMATLPAFPTIGTGQRIGEVRDAAKKPQSITTQPEVTRFDAGFNVVYVGSGRYLGATDLPDPATLTPPENLAYQQTVYGFKDTGADLGDLRLPGASLVPQILSVMADGVSRTITNNKVDWATQNGWLVDLDPSIPPAPPGTPPGVSPGERVNIDMQLVRGVLLVETNEPNSAACSTGGNRFFYQFDYQSGSYVATAPDKVVGVRLGSALGAGFVVYRLPSGQLKYTEVDVTGGKKGGGVNPGLGGLLGKRVSWRELML
jgi:type IV pilus assembly protein PilY1